MTMRMKAGYLHKLKGGWKSRSCKEMTCYFFRLNATYFQQLATEHDSCPKKSPLVSDIKDVRVHDIRQLSFDVQLRKEGTWTLIASTEQEMLDWMEALQPGSTAMIQREIRRDDSTQCVPPYPVHPMPAAGMTDRRSSLPPGIHLSPQSVCTEPRYVASQLERCRLSPEQTAPPSYASSMYHSSPSRPHQPLQLANSLPALANSLPASIDSRPPCELPKFVKTNSTISQPEDDPDGQTSNGLYMTAGDTSALVPRRGFHKQISIDDEGYVPMSLPYSSDRYDTLQPRCVSHSQQPSQMMASHYDSPRPLGPPRHQSLNDTYLVPVDVTPPRSPRMRHRSMAAIDSQSYRLPIRPSATIPEPEGVIDVAQDQDARQCLKQLPLVGREQLVIQREINKGNFCVVYQAVYKVGNVPAAAKVLKFSYSEKDFDDFIKEAYIVNQLHHPNIIGFYGVVKAVNPPYLVLELMENGSLDLFLQRVRSQRPLMVLIHYLRDIMAAMVYLSQRNFVHRDLAARNILVSRSERCKVSDFGLSRKMDKQLMYVSQGGRVATKWAAPEALTEQQFTIASDVWSFGVVMWEVLMFGDTPYGDWTGEKTLVEVTTNHYRLPKPKMCPPQLYEIMWNCWQHVPEARPSFSQINKQINQS